MRCPHSCWLNAVSPRIESGIVPVSWLKAKSLRGTSQSRACDRVCGEGCAQVLEVCARPNCRRNCAKQI